MTKKPPESKSIEYTTLNRRAVLVTGATVAGSALAGCLGDDDDDDDDVTSVAIISSPAGFGDQSFNDAARSGLEEASDEFEGIEFTEVDETDEGVYESVQADLAETGDHDLIVMVGLQHFDPLQINAEEYPDQLWMLINDHVESPHNNVSGWIEMNHEMSFLAGIAAGTLTQEEIEHAGSSTDPDTHMVGFAGGEDIDLINAFEESYIQGIEWIEDNDGVDIEVRTGYGGSFSDPSGVNDVSESQFDEGADIVWHAASAAGAGAFEAAADNDRFALGVDDDQSVTSPEFADVILGSAVKDLGGATYSVSIGVHEDNWDEWEGEQNLSIEEDGIDFIIGQEFEGQMPDALLDNLDAAKQDVIDGEVDFRCGPTGC